MTREDDAAFAESSPSTRCGRCCRPTGRKSRAASAPTSALFASVWNGWQQLARCATSTSPPPLTPRWPGWCCGCPSVTASRAGCCCRADGERGHRARHARRAAGRRLTLLAPGARASGGAGAAAISSSQNLRLKSSSGVSPRRAATSSRLGTTYSCESVLPELRPCTSGRRAPAAQVPDGPAAAGESRPFNHHSRPYAGLIVCDGETAAAT